MGRTDWAPIILGGGLLIGGAYVFFNWKTLCHNFGEGACNLGGGGGIPGLFGGTITNNTMPAQGYGQILTNPTTGQKQVIRPDIPITGAKASVKGSASIPSKPKLNASGSVGAGAGAAARRANYTDFHSFNTITLNKLSVR